MKKLLIVGISFLIFFSCFAQHTPSISASASPQTICEGDSSVLTATGGVDYQWSHGLGNGQSVTAHPTTTTIYTVTATDANGCTATASVSVNVLTAPPTASFIINPSDCYSIGQPIDFVATDPNADTWLWNFYPFAGATTQQTTQTFNDYGFQCISLIVSNACGSDTSYQYIYVADSLCNCDTITWHINGLLIANDTLLQGPQNVKGDIFVQSGVTLTMSGNFYFHPASRIVVEEYATLILGEIAFLDKVPGCEMWQGIEVWGNTNQPSTDPVQGKVILGSANIHNAHVAILLGKRNMEYLCKATDKLYDLDKSGGVVVAVYQGAPQRQFFKNGCGIRYIIKNNREASANQLQSMYFACQSPLYDVHYNSAVINHYPNHLNPWAGNANPLQRTWKAIAFDNLENIQVRNNIFLQLEYGVHAINSKSYLLNSTFIDVSYGFYALHTQQSMQNKHLIAFNEFNLINKQQSGEGKGIYILNGLNDYIHSNLIRNTLYDTIHGETAIQLDFTSNYRVNENEINYYKRGIVANWNISGFIGAQEPAWGGIISQAV
jgi:PKD repeat protein